jgi:hypothetical protein
LTKGVKTQQKNRLAAIKPPAPLNDCPQIILYAQLSPPMLPRQ